jgi:hypothetical protein
MASNLPDFGLWAAGQQAAQKYGVDPDLVHHVIMQESSYRPDAVSPKGAVGIMQLMPGTAKDLGVKDSLDATQNIDGGVRYLAQLYKQFGGDRDKVLAAYNMGPGKVARGAPQPKETQDYVAKVGGASPSASQGTSLPDFAEWAKGQQPQNVPEEKSLGGFLTNVVTSGGHAVEGLANVVAHPIDTVKGLGNAVMHPVDSAKAIGKYASDRYGGGDKILDTLYHDPVGAMMDASMILEPAAGLAKSAGFALPGALRMAANPLRVASEASEALAPRIAGAALPITKRFVDEYEVTRPMLGKVMLDEGAGLSQKGVSKLDAARSAVSADKKALESAAMNRLGPAALTKPQDLVGGAQDLLKKKGIGVQATPATDIAAVNEKVKEFLDQFITPQKLPNGQTANVTRKLDPLEMEQMKQGTYAALRNTYSQEMPSAARQANQELAGAMKRRLEDITNQLPNQDGALRSLNQRDKLLSATKHSIEDYLNKEARGGISLPGVGEMVLTGSGHMLPAAIMHLMRNPGVEQFLAKMLYHAPGPAAAVAGPTVALQRALTSMPEDR